MTFKKIIPYIFTSIIFLSSNVSSASYNNDTSTSKNKKLEQKYNASVYFEHKYDIQKQKAESKARQLISTYVNNAVNGTKRILESKKRSGYSSAVRQELPGAPCTHHCLYGQYTQLNRAIAEAGDTIKIIPSVSNAHMATSSFKRSMTNLYNNEEYPNTIYYGHLYTTNLEYNKALDKYLDTKMRNQSAQKNTDSLCAHYTQEFEKNNYCTNNLNPGTIVIVSSGHAVMYLGQGEIKNHEFIPTKDGEAVCCSYNKEHPAIYLNVWNTNNAFAADIQNIITQKYYEQLEQSR